MYIGASCVNVYPQNPEESQEVQHIFLPICMDGRLRCFWKDVTLGGILFRKFGGLIVGCKSPFPGSCIGVRVYVLVVISGWQVEHHDVEKPQQHIFPKCVSSYNHPITRW